VAGADVCGVGDGAGLGCACGQAGKARARASNSPRSFLIVLSPRTKGIFRAEGVMNEILQSGTLEGNESFYAIQNFSYKMVRLPRFRLINPETPVIVMPTPLILAGVRL
jgi:hypothetical protein